jgi:checkpoint serine/threonine-protein kinase
VDFESNNTPLITPRTAVSCKNSGAPGSVPKLKEHVPRDVLRLKSVPEDSNVESVFSSKVFTPAETKPPALAPLRDVFTDDHGKPKTKAKPTHERARSHHDPLTPAPEIIRASAFTPFVDEHAKTPFKVFSRPPEQEENSNAFTSKTPAFTPFTDPKPTFTPFRDAPVPFKPFVDQNVEQIQSQPGPADISLSDETDDSVGEEQDQDLDYQYDGEAQHYDAPLSTEDEYEEGESYREVPLGGRFGQFNVMTPITERTYEFTSSTREGSTPSGRFHTGTDRNPICEDVILQSRDQHGAALAAEQLVAELRREDEDEDYTDEEHLEPLQLSAVLVSQRDDLTTEIIEKTGSLSLGDTLTLNSKFKPPNPCNPFDPPLLATLLSRIPSDPHHYNLRDKESSMLDGLQRFAKKARKTSGNTSNTGVLDLSLSFPLNLDNHRFSVLEKLGEGGFGAVFKARDLGTRQHDEDSDEELDDYEDDGSSMVALKVVKPRNLWEYHVLRRLTSALPMPLRRSVILPHALYAFRDESYLVLDLCRQGTLLDIVNNAVAAGVSQQGACLDELLVMFFAIELLRLLEGIHNVGFIHGDLKIDNCLLRLEDVPGGASTWSSLYQPSGDGGWSYKGLKVIDFGRTIDTRLFPPGQQYIADWAIDDRDCFELQENRPWTYQTDYFGLAGIIYCMLYGKYIQASAIASTTTENGQRYKISTPMKRYWQTNLWNRVFDVLLNSSSAQQLPVSDELKPLRAEMETWLQANCNRTSNTLKGLLKKVEVSCLIR